LTDGELLGLFVTHRADAGETAFSALVERHGPIRGDAPRMVAICRIGRARAKAKDTQAARAQFARALEIAKDLKLNGQPDGTGFLHIAMEQAESRDYRAARRTLRENDPYPSADHEVELIALTRARAGDFAMALLALELGPQASLSTRSEVLREIVRLQVESGDDQHMLDFVEGVDSPVCEARILMGIAHGLTALKRTRAKIGAN